MSNTPREAGLISVVEAVRHEYDAALKHCGLSMEPPSIAVLRPAPDSYTCEMRIDIVQLGTRQLADRLEFFAFEGGKQQVTEEELRVWLVEQVAALTKGPL
jgi:hypothetical protein